MKNYNSFLLLRFFIMGNVCNSLTSPYSDEWAVVPDSSLPSEVTIIIESETPLQYSGDYIFFNDEASQDVVSP